MYRKCSLSEFGGWSWPARSLCFHSLDRSVSPRLRSAVLGLFLVLAASGFVGTALSPYLLVNSPLTLVAITGAAHHVALAAATEDAAPVIVVATLRRALTGLGAYGLGYLYGPAAFTWLAARYPRLSRIANLLERLFARWGVLLLVAAPARTLAVLAGAARSSVRSFLLAYSAGHALWSTLTYYVGDALSSWTARLTAFLSAHLWESTAVCVLLVLLQQAISRARRARAKPDELEQPLG
jgi:membrane protein DedA with SNARE-associated domain